MRGESLLNELSTSLRVDQRFYSTSRVVDEPSVRRIGPWLTGALKTRVCTDEEADSVEIRFE